MMLLEFDKAGAEWVVVAYLSGDARMIDVIETGKRPHAVTGSTMTGCPIEIVLKEDKLLGKITDPDHLKEEREAQLPELIEIEKGLKFLPRSMTIYQCGKKSNHGLNYREQAGTFALINEIPERDAQQIVSAYSTYVYPGIQGWWDSIDAQLKKDRTFVNCFGRKAKLMDEWGQQLKNKATSFVPQSTVSDCVIEAIRKAYQDPSPVFQRMDLLTETYDSATVQYPIDDFRAMAQFAIKFGLDYLCPQMEYNGRSFTIKTDLKVGLNWGNMLEVKLVNNIKELAASLKAAHTQLTAKEQEGRKAA